MTARSDVTVVIPTHNRADLVKRAIRSVLAQTHPVAEVLVVDDASEDRTQEVLEGFKGQIKIIALDESEERGAARNRGAETARAPWIAFLDSDDEWYPHKLEAQFDALGSNDACVTAVRLVDQNGMPLGVDRVPDRDAERRIAWKNPFFGGPSSLLINKSAFLEIGGFVTERHLQGSEDWIFFATLLRAGKSITIVREPLVRYRVHGKNSSADARALARSMWGAVEHMGQTGFLPSGTEKRCRAHTAETIARAFAAQREWRNSLGWLGRSIASYPSAHALVTVARVAATASKTVALRRKRELA